MSMLAAKDAVARGTSVRRRMITMPEASATPGPATIGRLDPEAWIRGPR